MTTRSQPLRLPQDAFLDARQSRRGVPDLSTLGDRVERCVALRDQAIRDGDFDARVRACWGLVARGGDALGWVEQALWSGDPDAQSDAAGVLAWIGVPGPWVARLEALRDSLPRGEPADAIARLLPPEPAGNEAFAAGEIRLGGEWDAFTSDVCYLDAPLDEAIRGIREGHDASYVAKLTFTPVEGSLETLLARLEPWAMPSWKRLVVAMDGGWSALFSQGSDIYQFDVAARHLGRRCVRTIFEPHVIRDARVVSAGCRSFQLINGSRADLAPLHTVRVIHASYDSRWEWLLQGEAQPFEDTGAYRKRVIAERFDLAALNRCCAALGIRRGDPRAYGPRAILIELDIRSWSNQPRTMSAAEWRRQHR